MQLSYRRKRKDYRIVPGYEYYPRESKLDKLIFYLQVKNLFSWKSLLTFDTKEEAEVYIKHMTGES